MSKNEKEIWSKLSEQADQFEMPVEDFVWDAIEKETFAEKKKRKGFFGWKISVGIFLLILFPVAYALLFSPYDLLENRQAKTQHKYQEWHSQKQTSTNTLKAGLNGLDVDEAEANEPLKEIPSQALLSSNQISPYGSSLISTNFNATKNSGSDVLKDVKDDIETPIAPSNVDLNIASTKSANSTIDTALMPLEVLASNSEITERHPLDDSVLNDRVNADSNVIETESTEIQLVNFEKTDTDGLAVEVEKKSSRELSRLSLLLRGGAGESFRLLSSLTHHDLIAHKNEYETFGGCYAAGLDIQYDLNNRFIIRSGIGYKFYSDKYDFQHDLISHRTRNDYQYVQMPIIFGYAIWSNQKSRLYLLGGGNVNLLTSAQSSWIDPNLLIPVAHSSNSNNTPFRSVTGALTLSLDFNVELSDHIKLHFIPSFDSFINSIYKRSTDLNELPYSMNMDLGISYQF